MRYGPLSTGLLCLGFLINAAPLVSAQSDATVVFGGALNYPPHHFLDDAGRPTGFDVDLATAIGDYQGWETDFRFGDWDVIQRDLSAGVVDVVPMFVSESRGRRYLFSDPILIESHFLYGVESAASLRDLAGLEGRTVAAEVEAFALQELAELGTKAILVPAASEVEALRMAARGEVDYAISPSNLADFVITRDNLPVVRHSPPLLPVGYAFAINRDRPELVAMINTALTEFNRTGSLTLLSDRWLAPNRPQTGSGLLWLAFPLAVSLALFLFGAYYYRVKLHRTQARLYSKNRKLRDARKREISSARTDRLTGLYTRNYFLQQTGKFLSSTRSADKQLAVGVFRFRDLDVIQRSGGYGTADRYIQQIAAKLGEQNRCISGYYGQGEFSLLFEQAINQEQAVQEISAVLESLDGKYQVNDLTFQPQIHAGLVLNSDADDDEYNLLRKAHIALKTAEERSRHLVIYDKSLEMEALGMGLLVDLKKALAHEGFSWAYQPQLNLKSRKIDSAEMLIRWNHPQHGWIPPIKFISQAEQSGLINEVTRVVVRRAVATIREWKNIQIECNLSINISANDLADNHIADYLITQFRGVGEYLILEITETAIMKDVDSILHNVERLRDEGIKLSLDDYGTGYSSLEYLKRFQFDELKIDKLFIDNISSSERDCKLTQASINLGHDLGAKVVAEGVEDEATASLLIQMNCDILQGYAICRPVPIDEFIRFKNHYLYNLAS